MGSTQSHGKELEAYSVDLTAYTLINGVPPLRIWRHNYSPTEIMEYREPLHSKEDIGLRLAEFKIRHQHLYLVASLYVGYDRFEQCIHEAYLGVFYERVLTNLSRVKDIPFQDSLHCYLTALKGFQLLYEQFGFFQVFEDMFHICQNSKLKVWCNKSIYKHQPETYLIDQTGCQQDMIIQIINIIHENTDKSSCPFSVRGVLFKAEHSSFKGALQSFREMCRTHKFSVPEKMESMAGSNQEIEAVLDIYSLEKKNHLDYVDFEQYSVKEKDRATSRVRGRVAGENGPPRPASSGKATSNQRNASVGSIRASAKDFPRFQQKTRPISMPKQNKIPEIQVPLKKYAINASPVNNYLTPLPLKQSRYILPTNSQPRPSRLIKRSHANMPEIVPLNFRKMPQSHTQHNQPVPQQANIVLQPPPQTNLQRPYQMHQQTIINIRPNQPANVNARIIYPTLPFQQNNQPIAYFVNNNSPKRVVLGRNSTDSMQPSKQEHSRAVNYQPIEQNTSQKFQKRFVPGQHFNNTRKTQPSVQISSRLLEPKANGSINISNLESNINILHSIMESRINTQNSFHSYFQNQSGIPRHKIQNSGRDSITSAFQNEFSEAKGIDFISSSESLPRYHQSKQVNNRQSDKEKYHELTRPELMMSIKVTPPSQNSKMMRQTFGRSFNYEDKTNNEVPAERTNNIHNYNQNRLHKRQESFSSIRQTATFVNYSLPQKQKNGKQDSSNYLQSFTSSKCSDNQMMFANCPESFSSQEISSEVTNQSFVPLEPTIRYRPEKVKQKETAVKKTFDSITENIEQQTGSHASTKKIYRPQIDEELLADIMRMRLDRGSATF